MLTTIGDVKGAFISCCAKINGMPLGRTSFQDFEIAYLLNIAYDKAVKSRVDALSAGFNTYGKDGRPHRDHGLGNILSELGNLYAPTFPDEEIKADGGGAGLIDESRWKLWGPNTRIFEVPKVNGYLPYVIGADLHEVSPKLRYAVGADRYNQIVLDKTWRQEEANLQSHNITFPVRILNGSEDIEFSALLQHGENYLGRLPFRIGRIRTYSVRSKGRMTDTVLQQLGSAIVSFQMGAEDDLDDAVKRLLMNNWNIEQLYVLELLHPKLMAEEGSQLFISIERVMHPQPISAREVKSESIRQLEVSFGYEIAEEAAKIGMEALASGAKLPNPQQQVAPK